MSKQEKEEKPQPGIAVASAAMSHVAQRLVVSNQHIDLSALQKSKLSNWVPPPPSAGTIAFHEDSFFTLV